MVLRKVQGNRLRSGIAGGGSGPLPTFAFQPETIALASAYSSAGSAMSTRRQRSFDRFFVRTKAAGIDYANCLGLYVAGPTEATWLINCASPGTRNLTKVGSPTYTANDGGSGFGTGVYYDTNMPLQSFPQNGFSAGIYSKTTSAVTGTDFGAQDSAGNGITIGCRNSSNFFAGRLGGAVFTSATTSYWSGDGVTGITRTGASAVNIGHHGVWVQSPNTSSIAAVTNPTLRIGGAANNAGTSPRKIGAAYGFSVPFTAAQEIVFAAALRDLCDKIQYGDVDIQPAGYQPQVVTVDVAAYGGSMASLAAAYAAVRAGKTACIILDWEAWSDWDIGGMPTAGLSFCDSQNFSAVSGIFRDMISWLNANYYGSSDTNTQGNLSPESRAWQQVVRRVLDPTRTGSLAPGMDVQVYLSTGIASVQKTGAALTSITTNDGRTFLASQFIAGDYDGELDYLAGCPVTIGTEAEGTSFEATNGYQGTSQSRLPYSGVGTYNIDPYVSPGVPASGLLPDIIDLPSITLGDPDPSIEPMNFRLAATTSLMRYANFDLTAPPNYNAQRYEVYGRLYATGISVSITPSNLQTLQNRLVANSTTQQDINSGKGGLSTDLGQSGINYVAAGISISGRQAVLNDLRDFTRGYFYWTAHSGDSRIPSSLVSQFNSLYLDALSNLDPGDNPNGVLFWPNRAYHRDPIWQLANSGFILNANQVDVATGTVPPSIKIVSNIAYFSDRHEPRRAQSGGNLIIQGSIASGIQPGPNILGPLPVECMLPDESVCTNLISPVSMSMTKIAWYMSRLEPSLTLAGESAGLWASMAIDGGTSVQQVDYTAFRTAMLANDTTTPVLPQTTQ